MNVFLINRSRSAQHQSSAVSRSSSINHHQQPQGRDTPPPPQVRSRRLPPITIPDTPCKTTIGIVWQVAPNFYTKKISTSKLLLHLNLVLHKAVCDHLKKHEIKFFTYTPKSTWNLSMLLKNLNGDFELKIVLNELCFKNIFNVQF